MLDERDFDFKIIIFLILYVQAAKLIIPVSLCPLTIMNNLII